MADDFRLTFADERFIEGYAQALDDIMLRLTGDSPSGKSYDPMTIRDGVMYSYAFDMKDGGRRHRVTDYASVQEICDVLVAEAEDWIKEQ